jgi:hypothetical protein
MEIRVERRPGFEYTNNHNVIELAVFRHNLDTTFVFGRPGMVYYMCVCPPQLPGPNHRSVPHVAPRAPPNASPRSASRLTAPLPRLPLVRSAERRTPQRCQTRPPAPPPS